MRFLILFRVFAYSKYYTTYNQLFFVNFFVNFLIWILQYLEKMRHCRSAITKDIQLVLFKVFPRVSEIKINVSTKIVEQKKYPQVFDAYKSLWKVEDTSLIMVNMIIMKAMPKERREYCLTLPIIAFTLTVCYIVLNPHGKDI